MLPWWIACPQHVEFICLNKERDRYDHTEVHCRGGRISVRGVHPRSGADNRPRPAGCGLFSGHLLILLLLVSGGKPLPRPAVLRPNRPRWRTECMLRWHQLDHDVVLPATRSALRAVHLTIRPDRREGLSLPGGNSVPSKRAAHLAADVQSPSDLITRLKNCSEMVHLSALVQSGKQVRLTCDCGGGAYPLIPL
jgi:hypothetical protein